MIDNIIKELKALVPRLEDLDDPTEDDNKRALLDDAVYSLEECISTLEKFNIYI